MKIARVHNNKVREVRDDFADAADAQAKCPLPAGFGEWFDAPDNVRDLWDYDGTVFTPPPGPTAAEIIATLQTHADEVARIKLKTVSGSPLNDFDALRHQVAMVAKAAWLINKDRAGNATAKQKAMLLNLEKIGDYQDQVESARDAIKADITKTTTETDIDNDSRWP